MGSHPDLDLMGVLWRLGATILLVFINGFFVAAEFALVKVRKARISELADKGRRTAATTGHLLAHLDYYLSACQLGITLASLVLGALGEPAVARLLVGGAGLVGWDLDPTQPAVRAVSLVVAFITITILHMTVGEQAPKMMALQKPEAAAMVTSIPLRLFGGAFVPLIWLINAISNAMLRWAGLTAVHGEEAVLTTTELRSAIARSAKAGHLPERGQQIVDNVLRMVKLEVRHILVPRAQVVFLSTSDPVDDTIEVVRQSRHTRFPLCDGSLDAVVGILHSKEVFKKLLDPGETNLSDLARDATFVPERLPLHRFALRLQQSGDHAAIVIDGHGSVTGMAFLEDAIEKVVGPIADEFHELPDEPEQSTEGIMLILAATPLPDVAERLGLDLPEADSTTIGGHVTALLERLPEQGDRVQLGDYDCTVTELTDRGVPAQLRFERREPDSSEP